MWPRHVSARDSYREAPVEVRSILGLGEREGEALAIHPPSRAGKGAGGMGRPTGAPRTVVACDDVPPGGALYPFGAGGGSSG